MERNNLLEEFYLYLISVNGNNPDFGTFWILLEEQR